MILRNLSSYDQICAARLNGRPPKINDLKYSDKNSEIEIAKHWTHNDSLIFLIEVKKIINKPEMPKKIPIKNGKRILTKGAKGKCFS